MVPARMRAGDAYVDVCIRNISSRGMMLQTANPPPAGTYIEILRGAHTIVGRIMWTKDRRFGMQAAAHLDIPAIVNQQPQSRRRPTGQERRSPDRPRATQRQPDITERVERSRRIARASEFGLVITGGLIGAGLLAAIAYDTMARPFESIAAHLR
jgi:hypothetical protein